MMRDDYDQVDIDAPIPFTITAQGLRDLAEWRELEKNECPQHEWKFEHGGVVCQNCNRFASVGADQSIPAYLRRKEK